MPTSRSRNPNGKSPQAVEGSRFLWPLILIAVLAVSAVIVIALPASTIKRFLPHPLEAEDFSGSLWHGSAGKITRNGSDAGAIEWRLHPGSLLSLTLSAELHWVNAGFVADGAVDLDRHGFLARDIQGSGPLEDLQTLGLPAGWRGAALVQLSELKVAFAHGTASGTAGGAHYNLVSAVGDIRVTDIASTRIADGADLGSYVMHLAEGAITSDGDATIALNDTGGPLEVQAVIHFSAKDHTGLLSGTIKERPGAPQLLREQVGNLAQMHARDAQGRIPVDFEFTP